MRDIPLRLDGGAQAYTVRDISRSGICFFSEEPIAEMTQVQFALELPGNGDGVSIIEAAGVVVRCLPISRVMPHYEIALFLSDLNDDARALLESYLREALGR